MSARRPLVTATAAGTMLLGLWFVPSANATVEKSAATWPAESRQLQSQSAPVQQVPAAQQPGDGTYGTSGLPAASEDGFLADTGSVDTTPYLLGGSALLVCGAAIVTAATRRSRGSAL